LQDVVNTLENAGFEITRQTERSISIKNPDGKRNIRLEGVIYENRQFDKQLAEEHSRAGQDYQRTSRERYETASGKLHRFVENKQRANQETFKLKSSDHPRSSTENQKRFAFEYSEGNSLGRVDYSVFNISRRELLAREANPSQESGTSRTEPQNRPNTFRETNFTQSEISRNRGQKSHFNHSEQQQESRSLREHQQQNGTQTHQVKADFENPFNQSNDGMELLQKSGDLFENLPSQKQIKQPVKDQSNTLEQDNAKRLYESLQRIIELFRETVERFKRNKSKTDRADRNLERSESSIENAERGIEQSKSTIKQSEQQITRAEQHIDAKMKLEQQSKKQDYGITR
jgi:hypothetical protein